MIREVGSSLGRAVLDGVGRTVSRLHERKSIPVDLLERDDAYLAVFDAPGATATDVSVRFDKHTLSVRIDRFREFHDGYEMVFPGRGLTLKGEVELPETASVIPKRAEATLTRNGTLQVLIPKAMEAAVDESETSELSVHDSEDPVEDVNSPETDPDGSSAPSDAGGSGSNTADVNAS